MISHHIYLSVAMAHKESQIEAARQAHQARSLRRLARTSHPRRSFLSRIASRLGALNYADGHGVGTVRYVRDADDPQAAEIAVTVVDDRQGLGAGTELLTRLPGRGRRDGIRHSTALVSADKTAMTGLLRSMSAEIAARGAVEYEITLAAGDQHTPCVGGQAPAVTQLGFLAHTDLGPLAGRTDVSTRAGVISHQRNQLPLPGPRRRPERRSRASRSTE